MVDCKHLSEQGYCDPELRKCLPNIYKGVSCLFKIESSRKKAVKAILERADKLDW